MPIDMSIILLESNIEIQKKINKAMVEEINSLIKKNAPRLKRLVVASIPNWVVEQPEIDSLLAAGVPNTLNAEFGIPFGTAGDIVDTIVESIVSTIEVKFVKVNQNFNGGVQFRFQPSNFINLLGLKEGHTAGVSLKGEDYDIHWLESILTRGDETIVVGYRYTPAANRGRSRGGVMEEGGVWRVPPEFSGVDSDNFITRAFSGREKELELILTGLFR